MNKKDARQNLKKLKGELRRVGTYYLDESNGHPKVRRVDNDGLIYTMAGTPSDHRSWKNTVAALKRLGVVRKDFR